MTSRTRYGLNALTLLGTLGLAPAAQAQFYTTNFTSPVGAEWSNTTRATSNGETFLGTSANGFGNGTVNLNLTGLPAHNMVTLNFDLYIIQSWDGNGPAGGGVDAWRLAVDGTDRILTTFANFTGGNTQAYPNMLAPLGAGGAFAPKTGAFELGHLGFGDGDFGDTTYRFSLTFPHTANTIGIDFNSLQNQAPGDEGWGLDNVSVTLNTTVSAVPEPSTYAMMGAMGLAVVGFLRRRRK